MEKKTLVWKVFPVSFTSCVNEAPGNTSHTYASVFPRPLHFSTGMFNRIPQEGFSSAEGESCCLGNKPRGWFLAGHQVLLWERTLHTRQTSLRTHACWGTNAQKRWSAFSSLTHSLCPTWGPHLQLQGLFAPKLRCRSVQAWTILGLSPSHFLSYPALYSWWNIQSLPCISFLAILLFALKTKTKPTPTKTKFFFLPFIANGKPK